MLSFLTTFLLYGNSAWASGADREGTFWMPPQASTFAADVDFTYYFIYWIDVVFFIVLMGAMIMFAVQYRQKKVGEKTLDLKGSHTVELAWAVFPSFLLIAMFFLGFQTYMKQVIPPSDALEVRVVAQKWNWTYSYPELGIENTSVMVVPQGRPIKLVVSSKDVLHSFFVPDFRIKKDAVPGRYTVLWFQADEIMGETRTSGNMPVSTVALDENNNLTEVAVANVENLTSADDAGQTHVLSDADNDGYTDGLGVGEHQVFCTEYCGTDHSRMYSRIRVVAEEDFDAWVTGMTTVDLSAMTPAERGARLYKKSGCAGCHSVDGSRLVGPSFQGLWGRQENIQGEGPVTVNENYILQSIWVPGGQIVEGYANQMPSYQGQLDQSQVDDIIAFIKTLE